MKVIFSSLLLLFPQSHQAFTLTTTNVKRIASSSSSSSSSLSASTVYGRGAEIWPECNEEPVKLEDSFPNGIIPPAAKQQQLLASSNNNNNNSEKTKDDESLLQKIDPTPAFITISLLLSGLIRPLDIIIVTALGGYIGILERFARSPRTDGVTPIMPSLPPQGHVPDLVLNPLGKPFTNAIEYEGWLKSGAVLSLYIPMLAILRNTVLGPRNNMGVARACARPLFLLCCQAMGETLTRRAMSPLPLRILVPVIFNTVRLVPLWSWAMLPSSSTLMRVVAYSNLIYWSINLLGFLLPVAVMRYLRVHFYCIEAEEVQTRPGFEGAVGLLP